MTLYISFADSLSDPTYSSASNSYLVESDYDGYGNPCSNGKVEAAPVIPTNRNEVIQFAKLLGWGVRVENGKIFLDTGIDH